MAKDAKGANTGSAYTYVDHNFDVVVVGAGGAGLEKHTASKIAWATLAGSISLTLLIWIAGYMARGA